MILCTLQKRLVFFTANLLQLNHENLLESPLRPYVFALDCINFLVVNIAVFLADIIGQSIGGGH